jgi:biopolymer transport protein ExbB
MAGEDMAVPIDITGGAALKQLARAESAWEMLLSGGPLVWPILLVGLISLALIVERLGFLRKVRANTDQLMGRVNELVQAGDLEGALAEADSQAGRPTSNVIKAGPGPERLRRIEVIENGLTEAMLKELPRLERFLTALKVMAAVAPLLGLLGTVTGMINTFHVITVHGTGDPRLMAGGISEALITTQLGLAVAIPVLVAAALLSRKAQRIASDMEEKAVAMSAALIQEGSSL